MKITEAMVVALNSELVMMGCPFRFQLSGECESSDNPVMKLMLPSMNGVNCFTMHLTSDFLTWLKVWFQLRGVELSCNNSGDIFWSRNEWEEI